MFAKHGIDTNPGQQAWYAAKEKTPGDAMKREYSSIPSEAFQQSIEGVYYARQFAKLYAEKRIGVIPDNSHLPVMTFWDIGVGDTTAIWFVRIVGDTCYTAVRNEAGELIDAERPLGTTGQTTGWSKASPTFR
ncbi:hypothetical protein PS898_02014 [Pseudomonas fluorescens]|nr:hypothetical protein PS898_02014 [Pseudomonas fluorescens]